MAPAQRQRHWCLHLWELPILWQLEQGQSSHHETDYCQLRCHLSQTGRQALVVLESQKPAKMVWPAVTYNPNLLCPSVLQASTATLTGNILTCTVMQTAGSIHCIVDETMQQGQQADKQWQQRDAEASLLLPKLRSVLGGGGGQADCRGRCRLFHCSMHAGRRLLHVNHLGSTHLWKQRADCRGGRRQPQSCRRAGRKRRANGRWHWAALGRDGCSGAAQLGVRWDLHRELHSGEGR